MQETKSSLLIIAACLLWALDLSARNPLTQEFSFSFIIFIESLLGLLFTLPWLLKQGKGELKTFTPKEWALGFFLGAIGMASAGYLLNASIKVMSTGTFSFFQIFQPLIVIFLASIFLKEKFENAFLGWGIWVIGSALLMFSPDFIDAISSGEISSHPSETLVSLGVMSIWAICTIAGKKLLQKHSAFSLVTVRWLFSLMMSALFLVLQPEQIELAKLMDFEVVLRFLFISGIAGILSMTLYYNGLKNLPAWKVSVLELAYPAMGMVFSTFYGFDELTLLQNLGILSFMTFVSLLISKKRLTTK